MKRMTGMSLAVALGSALLLSVALPGSGRAASFGAVAGVAENAAPLVETVQARMRGARTGGGRVAGGRVGGGGRIAGGRVGGGYRGGYRGGGRGAGLAAGIAGAAILGGILAESQRRSYEEQYYYGAPVYEEPVYVRPRRYYRRYDNFPRNPARDPAGGGVMR